MSGAIRLTLRPPPNVDFVQGYPGIGPGPNRPHASVGGSVEVRVADSHPIKAKWVHVELRRIEILPGGGQTNSFSDVVRGGSFNVWSAKGEWEAITARDIPFSIKIPEDVPPSIALENGGGIKYELVASISYKAKKGLFRRDTTAVISASAPIVIDKHELHSAWPAYCQKDVRQANKDGLTLTVERGNVCYGPGDRVQLHATIQCSKAPINVRSFEMALRETAVFRAAAEGSNKTSNGPRIRSAFVGSEKVPVNMNIPATGSQSCDLGCLIPTTHTTTTVVTAAHIEVIYSVAVRAMFADGRDLVIDNIPVMMSNWQRSTSEETVRRIGHAAHLSLDPPTASPSPARLQNQTNGSVNPRTQPQQRQVRPYTIPARVNSLSPNPPAGGVASTVNEFGQTSGPVPNGYSQTTNGRVYDNSTQEPQEQPIQSSAPGNRPTSASEGSRTTRTKAFSVVNADVDSNNAATRSYMDAAQEKAMMARQQQMVDDTRMKGTPGDSVSQTQPNPENSLAQAPQPSLAERRFLNAEEEKRKLQLQSKLFQEAKHVAEATQASVGNPDGFSPQASGAAPVNQWPTDEKQLRMFEDAQAKARRTQALAAQNPNAYVYDPSRTPGAQLGNAPRTIPTNPVIQQEPMRVILPPSTPAPHQRSGISAGASLYQSAISSISPQSPPASESVPAPAASRLRDQGPKPPVVKSPIRTPQPANQWPSALQEKDTMKYLEAKRAVDRHQGGSSTDPVPYDALYPSNAASSTGLYSGGATNVPSGPSTPTPPQDAPSYSGRHSRSPSNASGSPNFRQQSTGNVLPQTPPQRRNTSTLPSASSPPPPMSPIMENGMDQVPQYSQPARPLNAMEEKALLKQKYEQEDAATSLRAGPSSDLHWSDPPPLPDEPPPPADSSVRPLSAADEKDLLRARYEAADRVAAAGLPPSLDPPSFGSHQWQTGSSQIPDGMPQYVSPTIDQYRASGYSNGYANDSPRSQSQSVPPPSSYEEEPLYSPIPQRPTALARFPPNTNDESTYSPPDRYDDSYPYPRSVPLSRDPSISLGKRAVQSESSPPFVPEPPTEYMDQEENFSPSWSSPSSGLTQYTFDVLSPFDVHLGRNPPPIPPKVPLTD